MAYAQDDGRWGLRAVERPARRLLDSGLGSGQSLIEPGTGAWTPEVADELGRQIIDKNLEGQPGGFVDKLHQQLAGTSRAAHLLLAELLALQSLPLGNLDPDWRLERVKSIVNLLDPPAELPADVSAALNGPGVFHGGRASTSGAWRQIGWLVGLVRSWWTLSDAMRHEALSDPWAFHDVVTAQPLGQNAIRNTVLYLAFPDIFLPAVAQVDRVAIRDFYADSIGGASGDTLKDIDRDLVKISRKVSHDLGVERANFYDDPRVSKWKEVLPARWEQSPVSRAWAVRGSNVDGYDLVPAWLHEGFVSLAATRLRPLELPVGRNELGRFVEEDYSDKQYAARQTKVDEFDNFINKMNDDDYVIATTGGKAYVGRIIGDAQSGEWADKRAKLRREVEWLNASKPVPFNNLPSPLPAKLHTQNDVVELTEDMAAIEKLIAELTPGPDPVEPVKKLEFPQVSADLSQRLLADAGWLQRTVSLLWNRRQLIFYGPPGTGKTYIAREIAQFLQPNPSGVKLVQFHPSYTYEDFFEGFRPEQRDDGQLSFKLKWGPFRRLVEDARDHPGDPYILIIDEINRGNLAKVFGELYFLLEYRGDAISLLYSSDETFTLPENVFIIATMNTSDRSIGLIDAAMRRRFAFVELHPAKPPTAGLLDRWIQREALGAHNRDTPALLEALNARIQDRDLAVGPSYFMKKEIYGSADELDVVWETSIMPLMEEYHYGSPPEILEQFRLDKLRKVIGPVE